MTIDTQDDVMTGALREDAGTSERDVSEDALHDIYAVLGLRPDASRALAREMYWSRIQPLLDPARRDDPDARATIEALNDALTIISDEDLRAAYDAAVPGATSTHAEAPHAVRRPLVRWAWRAFLAVGLTSAVAIGGATVSWTFGLVAACLVLLVPVVGTLAARRGWPRETAHQRLGIREDATRRDLDVAYQTRAQELLVRLGADPRTVEALNRLDEDYMFAMRQLMAADLAQPATSAQRVLPLLAPLGRLVTLAAAAFVAAGREGFSAAVRTVRGSAQASGRTAEALRTRARDSLASAPTEPMAEPRPEVAEAPRPRIRLGRSEVRADAPVIDLEERLAASLKASTLEIARKPVVEPGEVSAEPPAARLPAYLLLFAPVGVRRVPVDQRPIRIGSAGDCDLVLPERDGVSAEHAMVWRRGDSVVLHATDPAAECHVNGQPCSWATLEDGDELRIGKVNLRIEIASPAT